ncbi:lysine-rich membrane-associated PHISTb protein [Plasmodium sp. DRC-Itaito]|nr:lysine-rich membrane-associated PHISTb protein [Plasmodium sp. DRC-Itaito]
MRFTNSLYLIKNNSVFDMNYLKINNSRNYNSGEEKNKNKNKNGKSCFKSLLSNPIVMIIAGIIYIVILNVCMRERNYNYQVQFSNRYPRKLCERFIYYNPNVQGGYTNVFTTCNEENYSDGSEYDVMKYANKVIKDLKEHELWNDHNKVPYTNAYMGVSVEDSDYVLDKVIDNMNLDDENIIDSMKYIWNEVMDKEKKRYLGLKNVLRKYEEEFPINNNVINNYNNKKFLKCHDRVDLSVDVIENGLNKMFNKCIKKNVLDKNQFKVLITANRFLWRKSLLDVEEECNAILQLPTEVSKLQKKKKLRKTRRSNPNNEISLRSYAPNPNSQVYGRPNHYQPKSAPHIIDYVYKVSYGENADEDVDRHIEYLVERMAEEEAERIAELSVEPYIEALESSYEAIAQRNAQNSLQKKVQKGDEMVIKKEIDGQENANMNNEHLQGNMKIGNASGKVGGANKKVGGAHTKVGGAHTKVGGAHTKVGGAHTKVGGAHTKVGGVNTKVGGTNTKVGGANKKVGGAHTKVGGTNTKVGGTNTKVGGANTKVGGANIKDKSGKVNMKKK